MNWVLIQLSKFTYFLHSIWKKKYEKHSWLVFNVYGHLACFFVLICSRAWNNPTTFKFSTWPKFFYFVQAFFFHKKGKTQSIISLGCFCFFTDTHLYDTLVVAPTDWFFLLNCFLHVHSFTKVFCGILFLLFLLTFWFRYTLAFLSILREGESGNFVVLSFDPS